MQKAAQYLWRRPALLNLVLVGMMAGLLWTFLTTAFAEAFTCYHLVGVKLGLGRAACDFSPTLGIASWFGATDPTLALAMDPALEDVRRGVLGLLVFGIIVASLAVTFVVNNGMKLVRLLRLDRQQWADLMAYLRLVLLIALGMLAVVFVVL